MNKVDISANVFKNLAVNSVNACKNLATSFIKSPGRILQVGGKNAFEVISRDFKAAPSTMPNPRKY